MKTQQEIENRIDLLTRVMAEMSDPTAISGVEEEIRFLKSLLDNVQAL